MAKISEISAELCSRYGLSPDEAMAFVKSMFDVVDEQLQTSDKSVKIKGLGTFKLTSVGSRASVDVNTGERIMIEGRNKISFTPEVLVRDRVNRPFSQFETVVLNEGVDFSAIDSEFDDTHVDMDESDETIDDESIEQEQTVENLQEVEKKKSAKEDEAQTKADDSAEQVDVDSAEQVYTDDSEQVSVGDATRPVAVDDSEPINEDESRHVVCGNDQEESVEKDDIVIGKDSEPSTEEPYKFPKSKEKSQDGVHQESVAETASRLMRHVDSQPICKQRNPRLMYWLTAASFCLLIAIGVGMYFIYQSVEAKNNAIEQLQYRLANTAKRNVVSRPVVVSADKSKSNTVVQEKGDLKKDSLRDTKTVNTREPSVKPLSVKEETAAKPKKNLNTPNANASVATNATDYNYDIRVRTGAYIIVGTDKVVTVKAGQTLQSISKANLGPGMECYVEVYNSCSTVKMGDKIKIPKLKLKPRR